MSFIEGESRDQISLLPACVDDYVAPDALVRIVDAFVVSLTWPSWASTGPSRRRLAGQDSSPVTCFGYAYGAISTRSDHRGISSAPAFDILKPCG